MALKRAYARTLYRVWYDIMRAHRLYTVVHGFLPSHSPVTNAAAHIGCETAISVDLKEFFMHCTQEKFFSALAARGVRPKLKNDLSTPLLFPGGVAAPGLPTSPLIANICFASADIELKKYASKRQLTYTRYADDLVLSSRARLSGSEVREIVEDVARIVEKHGFKLNPAKTEVQYMNRGRVVICGVAVGRDGIGVPRRVRRRLRAARHSGNVVSAHGLAAWCSPRLPRRYVLTLLGEFWCPQHVRACLVERFERVLMTVSTAQALNVLERTREIARKCDWYAKRYCAGKVLSVIHLYPRVYGTLSARGREAHALFELVGNYPDDADVGAVASLVELSVMD